MLASAAGAGNKGKKFEAPKNAITDEGTDRVPCRTLKPAFFSSRRSFLPDGSQVQATWRDRRAK